MRRVADKRASGGSYLAVDTAKDERWFATYGVRTRDAGTYRLDAVFTPPVTPDRTPVGGSYFSVSVNGDRFVQVARSEPYWATAPGAWGALVRMRLDDVELRRGTNSITFRVDGPRLGKGPARYSFALDRFALLPTGPAVAGVHVAASRLDTYRGGEPARLRFRLNGRARGVEQVRYAVTDYFSRRVASGTVGVGRGASVAAIPLPRLGAGHYRVEASLVSSPATKVVGHFARLPDRRPVATRFGVHTSSASLVPPARLAALARALEGMGAGHVRDEIDWPTVEPRRGTFQTLWMDGATREFGRRGIRTLGVVTDTPAWAKTRESAPFPADLRDAYRFTKRLAAGPHAALELWNEPEQEFNCCTTGDQVGAYVKAAALGVRDQPRPVPVALPGIFTAGAVQDLKLRSGVAPYADIWSFHSYPEVDPVWGGLTPFPRHTDVQKRLARRYGPRLSLWATEAGIFMPPWSPREDLTRPQQVDQARFLVQEAVQKLAAGVDRHFWFSAPPYCASGVVCFGLFSRDFQPWPSYSAYAAMTSQLGRADFVGKAQGMPRGVHGYVFRDGERAITVVWAGRPSRVKVPVRGGGKTEVYDVMGARTGKGSVTAGTVGVTASLDPLYVVSDGHGLRASASVASVRAARPSTAAHIVLSQRYAPANAAPRKDAEQPPPFGYRVGASTRMWVEVYNFNGSQQTVRLSARTSGRWSARPVGPATVRVPGMGRVVVPFTITAGDGVRPGTDHSLIFEGTLGGQGVPPTAALIQRTAR
ncbi:hypothetical protein [Spirillospora sp. CA-294931]|uniref:hypothetical protein n=1 Tax=Spirillospora sp. CA-294931 TaxID=3240042 RepID=UPI003D8B96F5